MWSICHTHFRKQCTYNIMWLFHRLDAVTDLMNAPSLVGGARDVLRTLPDLERLLRKWVLLDVTLSLSFTSPSLSSTSFPPSSPFLLPPPFPCPYRPMPWCSCAILCRKSYHSFPPLPIFISSSFRPEFGQWAPQFEARTTQTGEPYCMRRQPIASERSATSSPFWRVFKLRWRLLKVSHPT